MKIERAQKFVLSVNARTRLRIESKVMISKSDNDKNQSTALDSGKFNASLESINSMSAPAKSAQRPHGPFFYQTRTAPQPTVLVVEDHDDTREMLHMLLEMWGCRVVEACNGLEAVEAASRERPQFILMDSRLPFVDGLEATRRIRKNGLRDQVKILALNGSGSPLYHADALAAGCDDSIEKPFDLNRLRTYLSVS